MRTVAAGDREQLIKHRRALGLDGHDEMWEGVYHVAPHAHSDHGLLEEEISAALRPWAKRAGLLGSGAFNLGTAEDHRVPDRGYHRSRPGGVYVACAPLVVEILSPDDETFTKLDFYAAHGVSEVIVVLPEAHSIRCYDLTAGVRREPVSSVLGVSMRELIDEIAWPGDTPV